MYGYMGKILRVNLSNGTITEEFPDDNILKMFLGGAGLATKYLFDEVRAGIEPLSSENKLICNSSFGGKRDLFRGCKRHIR